MPMHHVGDRFRFCPTTTKTHPSQSLCGKPVKRVGIYFWMHRHWPPNQWYEFAICPHNSNWKSVAGESSMEVLITTAWVSSRRARAARQSSIQMEKIFKKWVLSLLLQGVLRTSTCGRTFTSSRIRLTKIVTKPKEWNDDASLCLQPFRVQNYLQLDRTPHFLIYLLIPPILNQPCFMQINWILPS